MPRSLRHLNTATLIPKSHKNGWIKNNIVIVINTLFFNSLTSIAFSCIKHFSHYKKEQNMQRSRTEAIRTQIQPSKPTWEIAKITSSQNTKRTYGQPSERLFPKRRSLSNPNRTTENHNKTTAFERSVINYWGLKLV